MTYRAEVEYRVRRVVYLEADTRAEAKDRAQDTTEWTDALDPHELVSQSDRIRVLNVKEER